MTQKVMNLKARRSFADLNKGDAFQAVIINAFVSRQIEMAVLQLQDGTQIPVPYDHFRFDEEIEETK